MNRKILYAINLILGVAIAVTIAVSVTMATIWLHIKFLKWAALQ